MIPNNFPKNNPGYCKTYLYLQTFIYFRLKKNKIFPSNTTYNQQDPRSGRFLFNQIFGLTSALTGGGSDSSDEDEDDGKTKNCTCGKYLELKMVPGSLQHSPTITVLTSRKHFSQNAAIPTRRIALWAAGPPASIAIRGSRGSSTTVISTAARRF